MEIIGTIIIAYICICWLLVWGMLSYGEKNCGEKANWKIMGSLMVISLFALPMVIWGVLRAIKNDEEPASRCDLCYQVREFYSKYKKDQ